jgi:hypothetical protein
MAAIEHVVLLSKSSGAAVQPIELKLDPVEWGVAVGGRARPNKASARFELRQVRELPAGDFDVVLITQYGERRCRLARTIGSGCLGALTDGIAVLSSSRASQSAHPQPARRSPQEIGGDTGRAEARTSS